jgi:hypothetical protein
MGGTSLIRWRSAVVYDEERPFSPVGTCGQRFIALAYIGFG